MNHSYLDGPFRRVFYLVLENLVLRASLCMIYDFRLEIAD